MHPFLQAPSPSPHLPPTYPPSPSSPLPPSSFLLPSHWPWEGRPRRTRHLPWRQGGPSGLTGRPACRGQWGGRGGGISGGKGGLGFHPAPPFLRPALPHFWAGPPNFGISVVFTTCLAQRSEKTRDVYTDVLW
jgi:hypothetical protein